MNELHKPIIGIDSAYDGPKTIDVRILKLAFPIVTYIQAHQGEFTDSYRDLIAKAAENIQSNDGNISLKAYTDYILDMTFAYAGRIHYDDMHQLVSEFLEKSKFI